MQNGGYVKISNSVIYSKRISVGAFKVYSILLSYKQIENLSSPSAKMIAYCMGINGRAVYKYIKELEELGLIAVDRRREFGITNKYTINPIPEEIEKEYEELISGLKEVIEEHLYLDKMMEAEKEWRKHVELE